VAVAAATRPGQRRLWRGFKRVSVWTIPVLIAVTVFGVAALSRLPVGQGLTDRVATQVIDATAALGLTVDNIEVEGRQTTDAATIMAALAAERGTPILAVSPSRAREQLQALPWVRSAVIERRLPGTLRVRLVERKPLAIWQHNGVQQLIDRDGAVIPVKELDRFAKLPIVVGDDAAKYAAALVDMLAREPELAARVAAAIHVGGRRWNLRVDGAIDVLLPESDPAGAWAQLARLERSNGLLKRDVQIVDLRFPDRLILRVNTPAPPKDAVPAKKAHPAGKAT